MFDTAKGSFTDEGDDDGAAHETPSGSVASNRRGTESPLQAVRERRATKSLVPAVRADVSDGAATSDAPDAFNASDASDASDVPDVATLSLPDLEARITELAGHLNAAEHRFLVLLAEFDRREGWADGSTRSCAHWLGWKCGLDLNTARERVRVARTLAGLPRIDAAMARGALSYSKARALTRAATPETEQTLLMIALHGTAHHVESVVRGFRRAQQAALLEREARQQANRGLTWHWDDDGTLRMQVCLPADEGALVLKALQQALDDEDRAARQAAWPADVSAETSGAGRTHPWRAGNVSAETSEAAPNGSRRFEHVSVETSEATPNGSQRSAYVSVGTSEAAPNETLGPDHVSAETSARAPAEREPAPTLSQRRADALVRFAETALAHGEAVLSGGERQQIVVHVDARTLVADRPGRSELDGDDGPVLAAETVRRLGCDASLLAIVEDAEGRVLDVGRRTRSIPPAIARALRTRDRGCRFPGCTQHRHVDAHHVEHWAHGGATKLSNLVLLCRRHHRAVHEGGVTVRLLDDGAVLFVDALGRRIDAAPPTRGESGWIEARHRDAGPHIDPDTAVTRWRGESMDLGLAVEGLCRSAQKGRSDPAPTRFAAEPSPPTTP